MADVLLKAVDQVNADPDADARGCYKRGDPVIVRPTGWPWGTRETLPRFVLVRLLRDDGITPVWAIPPGWEPDQPVGDPPTALRAIVEDSERDDRITDPTLNVTRRRAWRLVVDELPATARNRLTRDGLYAVRWTVVRDYLERKRDGGRATAIPMTEVTR